MSGTSLSTLLRRRIAADGGWWPFSRWMAAALYEPGLGYYARGGAGGAIFGLLPRDGSDFVTAPELSPLYGAALAVQVRQALDAAGARDVVEFGAGSGALAAQLLAALPATTRYSIVELSGVLRARQAETLAPFAPRVTWLDALPDRIDGVVVGNEVLDAMPVTLLAFDGERWHERGVAVESDRFVWHDRPTALRPPIEAGWPAGSVTELHGQALAFVRTLSRTLGRGLLLFVDYGFPEAEYYHPQRSGGTLACHRGHRVDFDPLADPGDKDITAHVDFSAVALAAQDAGLTVAGYTSQARFLLNCGLAGMLAGADARTLARAQPLVAEHEMGELFKAIALTKDLPGFDPVGFGAGDRSHTL